MQNDNEEILKAARPLIRSILAFLGYLRFGRFNDDIHHYKMADYFLNQLEEDIRKNAK